MAKKRDEANKNGAKTPKTKVKAIQLRIERVNPDNVRSLPVNDVIITHSQNEFFITFSSVEPPATLDAEAIRKMTQIDAVTRAKLVVSPDFLEAMIKALTTNLEAHKKNLKANVKPK